MPGKRFIDYDHGAAQPNPVLPEGLADEVPGQFEDERFDRRVVSYLLGEMSEEAAEQFEDECFDKKEWPEQVESVEQDLIAAYLRGELSPEHRQRFEQNYPTTTARRERVREAAALLRRVDEYRPAPQPTPTPAGWWRAFRLPRPRVLVPAALALVVLAAVAVWRLAPSDPTPDAVATLTLNISRGDRAGSRPGEGTVRLTQRTRELRITLTLPQGYAPASRYRTELSNEDSEVKPSEVVGHDAQTVSVLSAADQLRRGRYELKLFAAGADGAERRIPGSYFFTVE